MVARRVLTTVSRSSSFPACGAVSGANGRLELARRDVRMLSSAVNGGPAKAGRYETKLN